MKNNNFTIQVNVPFIFVMVLEIHRKPQFFKKIALAETAELRMTVSYTTVNLLMPLIFKDF